jgi:hypothetical protein
VHKSRFAEGLAKACRWCSSSGFVTFKKQNRELPYASVRPGKPYKRQQNFDPGRRNKAVVMQKESLLRAGLFAVSVYNEFVKVY